jgi:hypothetical protein
MLMLGLKKKALKNSWGLKPYYAFFVLKGFTVVFQQKIWNKCFFTLKTKNNRVFLLKNNSKSFEKKKAIIRTKRRNMVSVFTSFLFFQCNKPLFFFNKTCYIWYYGRWCFSFVCLYHNWCPTGFVFSFFGIIYVPYLDEWVVSLWSFSVPSEWPFWRLFVT